MKKKSKSSLAAENRGGGVIKCISRKDIKLDAVDRQFEHCPYGRMVCLWPGMLLPNSRGY